MNTSPNGNKNHPWLNLRADFAEIRISIVTYLRHPVREIRRLPDWPWRRILLAQILLTMVTGAVSGLVHHSVLSILAGLIQTPILTLITTSVTTLFFFYVFQVFQNQFVSFRELYLSIFFANIPFFVFQVISDYFPPILLIGLGFSALLLIVTFVANFKISRAFASRLIGGVYAILVVLHLLAWVNNEHWTQKWKHSGPRGESAPAVELGK